MKTGYFIILLTGLVCADVNITETPKSKKITMNDFQYFKALKVKYDNLSTQERKVRLELDEAKTNFGIAMRNFNEVLEIKTLIEDINNKEECYVAYFRIKDLNNKLQSSTGIETKIYHEIKAPLKKFLKSCPSLKIDQLKKNKGR